MMARGADSTRAAGWRKRLTRQGRSGVSVVEFCRREGVSTASFYAWRKRLRPSNSGKTRQPLFVPVRMPADVQPADSVQIELPGGAIVTLPTEASAELITAAIRAAMPSGDSSNGPSGDPSNDRSDDAINDPSDGGRPC